MNAQLAALVMQAVDRFNARLLDFASNEIAPYFKEHPELPSMTLTVIINNEWPGEPTLTINNKVHAQQPFTPPDPVS